MTTKSLTIAVLIGIIILGALTYVTFFSKWSVNSDTLPSVSFTSDEQKVENEDSIQQKDQQPIKPIENTVSFTINEIPRSSESLITIDVIADRNDTEHYSAVVFNPAPWYLTHGNSYLCFTKPTFKNFYCIEDKYLPIEWIREVDKGNMSDNNIIKEELDDITTSFIPYNALSAFLAPIEIALRALKQEGLSEGLQVRWPNNEEAEPVVTINNIKDEGIIKDHDIESIDIVSFVNATLIRGNITSGYNFEEAVDDQYIIELADEYNLNLDDYYIQ